MIVLGRPGQVDFRRREAEAAPVTPQRRKWVLKILKWQSPRQAVLSHLKCRHDSCVRTGRLYSAKLGLRAELVPWQGLLHMRFEIPQPLILSNESRGMNVEIVLVGGQHALVANTEPLVVVDAIRGFAGC